MVLGYFPMSANTRYNACNQMTGTINTLIIVVPLLTGGAATGGEQPLITKLNYKGTQ